MIIIMVIRSKPVLWDSIVSPHLPRSESWKSELSNLDQQSRGAFAFWRLPRGWSRFHVLEVHMPNKQLGVCSGLKWNPSRPVKSDRIERGISFTDYHPLKGQENQNASE